MQNALTIGNIASANTTYLTVTGGAGAIIGSGVSIDVIPQSIVQYGLTLTTTGTSGVATFIGNTLNIPNYGSALSAYLPLSGGTMTGQIVLKEGATSTDYTKGLRFPNDPYGGSGDVAGMRLYSSSGENMVLELYTGNDVQDVINFATGVGGTANNDTVTINGNRIWNAGNLTPQTQLNGTGFVKASGTTISYDKRELRSIITAFKAMDDEAVSQANSESSALATYAANEIKAYGLTRTFGQEAVRRITRRYIHS